MLEFTPEELRHAVETMGYGAVGLGFLAGLVFSFNPVTIAAIPVALAYVTRARERGEAARLGAAFVAGMLATHVALGLIAGAGGRWASELIGRGWWLLLGPLLIVLGLVWADWLSLPLLALARRAKRPNGAWGAFALGVPFSVAVCPICTPILLVLLGVVAAIGSPWLGAVVLLTFALGRTAPILLGAWAIDWLESLPRLRAIKRVFDLVGGVVLIATGLYLLNAYFVLVPARVG